MATDNFEARVQARGYDESAERSRELAEAFDIAAIVLESYDPEAPASSHFQTLEKLSSAGHIGPERKVEDVIPGALRLVRQKAESEKRMAEEAGALRDRLLED